MSTTFGDLWNRLLLWAPGTPPILVQRMIRNSYNRILARHEWSELFNDGEKIVAAEVSDTVSMTNGATTFTLVGLAATDSLLYIGRQCMFGDSPRMYDITNINTTTDLVTIESAYQGPTSATTAVKIGEYMVRFPSDLKVLDDVRDKRNNWRLRRQFHQQNYIDLVDPRRTHTGYPVLYAGCRPFTDANAVQYPRYEFWPRLSGETPLVYRYVKTSEFTSNTDTIPQMILPDAIIYGALVDLCLWPSTQEAPNPYFNLELHAKYVTLFEDALQVSIMNDTNRSQRMLFYEDSSTGYPVDASFWQAHGIVPR